MDIPDHLHGERRCLLTTPGRITGRRHTVELWFVPAEGGAYLMSGSGGLTQWSLNLQAEEQGVLRIADRSWLGRAAFLPHGDERTGVLAAFHTKYDPPGKDRTAAWARSATVVHLVLTHDLSR